MTRHKAFDSDEYSTVETSKKDCSLLYTDKNDIKKEISQHERMVLLFHDTVIIDFADFMLCYDFMIV